MFDLNSNFNMDSQKELEGVWEPLGDDSKILVARIGNSRYQSEYRKIPSAQRRRIENNMVKGKEIERIISALLAKTILLDWEGLGDNGELLTYSEPLMR